MHCTSRVVCSCHRHAIEDYAYCPGLVPMYQTAVHTTRCSCTMTLALQSIDVPEVQHANAGMLDAFD